ncbi:MAG: hypothetical protein ACRC7C_14360 [Beijerinckiaceae bacterium]
MHVDATPEPNEWVRPVSLGVTATLIVWCFCGWIIDKGWSLEGGLLAVMTGVFQALGFNASAQMRRAAAKGRARAKSFWAYVLCVTAGWTAFAAHHAYAVIAGEAPPISWDAATWGPFIQSAAALVLLAAAATIDPLLGWAIEETEKAPAPVSDPVENYADRMRATPVVDIKVNATKARPSRVARAITGAVIATSAMTALPAAATERPRTTTTDAQPKVIAPVGGAQERRAVALLADGVSLRSIERQTGVSYHRVRQLREMVSRAA